MTEQRYLGPDERRLLQSLRNGTYQRRVWIDRVLWFPQTTTDGDEINTAINTSDVYSPTDDAVAVVVRAVQAWEQSGVPSLQEFVAFALAPFIVIDRATARDRLKVLVDEALPQHTIIYRDCFVAEILATLTGSASPAAGETNDE